MIAKNNMECEDVCNGSDQNKNNDRGQMVLCRAFLLADVLRIISNEKTERNVCATNMDQ